jgi:Xrn1 helical domain
LREYLSVELDATGQPFPFDLERAIDDWVFLIFFVGNDFLPHLPSLEIREGAIDTLLTIWKDGLPRMGGYLTNHGSVELERAQVILDGLAAREDEIFRKRREGEDSSYLCAAICVSARLIKKPQPRNDKIAGRSDVELSKMSRQIGVIKTEPITSKYVLSLSPRRTALVHFLPSLRLSRHCRHLLEDFAKPTLAAVVYLCPRPVNALLYLCIPSPIDLLSTLEP